MRGPKAYEGVCCVTKTNQCAANFEVQVSLQRPHYASIAQVKKASQKQCGDSDTRNHQDIVCFSLPASLDPPEKTLDFARTSHKTPQMQTKNGQTPRCKFMTFLRKRSPS